MLNLGSLSLQLPDLSGSPLDAVDLSSKSAIRIWTSIRNLTRSSDITTTDDHFTNNHKNCCIRDDVSWRAEPLMYWTEGIELEHVASGAPPQKSTLLSQLSGLLEQFHTTRDTSNFEVVMRLTAIPNNTDFWQEVTIRSQATSDTRFAWCPKLKCIYCPGFEYSLFRNQHSEPLICEALERHVLDDLHCERVKRRKREIRHITGSGAALAT